MSARIEARLDALWAALVARGIDAASPYWTHDDDTGEALQEFAEDADTAVLLMRVTLERMEREYLDLDETSIPC